MFINGCIGSCHIDNFWCSQWWKFSQHAHISVWMFYNKFHEQSLLYYPGIILYMPQANERRRLGIYTKWAIPYGMMDLGLYWFRGGGYKANFLHSVIFLIFHNCQNKLQMLDIAFIFDRCCRSSAAMTPVKYECDSKNLTCTFARLKILLTEKLTSGALVTPTPGNLVALH